MFWNIYSKRVIFSLRSKDTLIWTWIFPVILSTLFFVTLSAVDSAGRLSDIPLGVVENIAYRRDTSLKAALESVSGESGNRLFMLTYCADEEQADTLLEKGEVDGYILVDDDPVLVVADDGINQTIAKSFLERYLQTANAAGALLAGGAGTTEEIPGLLTPVQFTEEISLSGNPPTDSVNFFYALLAMLCLYGGFQGLTTVILSQANLSPLGARRTMSPAGRFRMVLYDLLGGITVHFCCTLVTVAYIIFVLGTDFGSKIWMVLLTCFIGSILGVGFGALVSVTSRLKEQAKVAILICITMISCFLAGLMVSGINYTVAQKAPLVSWLNPAARITDAFYCLYYYDTYDRYLLNIGIVLAMALVVFAITSVFIRRQRYESI